MVILGMAGIAWICHLLWVHAPNWTWWISIPALIAIEFGAFAERGREHAKTKAQRWNKNARMP